MGRKTQYTEEERRELKRERNLKYYEANREAVLERVNARNRQVALLARQHLELRNTLGDWAIKLMAENGLKFGHENKIESTL